MNEDAFSLANRAAAYVRDHTTLAPTVAIVLGSGLAGVATRLRDATALPYTEIPGFPAPTVEGHSGRLLLGQLGGTPVAVMQGRVHAYEGYSPQQVTFPLRVLGRLGIRTVVFTNAAGAINPAYTPGSLVLIRDHINFTALNPLTGPNEPRFGIAQPAERFVDMSDAYAPRLRQLAQHHSPQSLNEGTYLCVPGPSFETPAEIRAFSTLGADLVGMSTVHEVIAARHMGMEVLGLSIVTNMAAGIQTTKIDHQEVLETGRQIEQQLTALLEKLIPDLV